MFTTQNRHSRHNAFYTPFDDETVTFGAAASAGLTPSKVASCEIVVIRFTAGEGRLRFVGSNASGTEGIPVAAGDVETMSRFEASRLSGIRTAGMDLVGWATYYR